MMSDDLRAALARLRPEERQKLAVRWQENSDQLEPANRALGRVWQVMTSLVLDVDRMERTRAAGLAHAEYERPVMRPASRGRR
ncbi:hypothetical protein [Actinomadura sp. 9N215]|uniref:hypothetical protein n=1 Tax=Actinomadura sp. 9N215 TaxID=3375150 RepID=UPI0037B8C6A9